VSFQSTSSCNLCSINSLPKTNLYVAQHERGRGEQKISWGIEMNNARELLVELLIYLISTFRMPPLAIGPGSTGMLS
jgi:hypothetical protein